MAGWLILIHRSGMEVPFASGIGLPLPARVPLRANPAHVEATIALYTSRNIERPETVAASGLPYVGR